MARKGRIILSGMILVLAALAADRHEAATTSAHPALQDDVPFRVHITELVQLDADVDPVGKLGDYYARVTINGVAQDNKPACGDAPNPLGGILVPFTLFSNFTHVPDCERPTPWSFTQQVPADAPVTVRILVLDGDLVTGDDDADATPGPGDAIELVVDPITGRWGGDYDWPEGCSRRPPFEFGNNNVRVCFQASFDSDGDGLLDVWERSGLDTDHDGMIDLDLPGFGADPRHKDLFVELDWMVGAEPIHDEVVEWKGAFAAAPVDAGGTPNPDGQPGINLWVDTGALTDVFGDLVGDNLGGGNEVPFRNVSALTRVVYEIKADHFAADRALVFRYGLSSARPPIVTSTGENTDKTLNDTHQDWIPDEWSGRQVEIVVGTGVGQTRTIVSNTATRLTVDKDWAPIPDETSQYEFSRIGGMGEIGGNDFVDFNHSSKTLMHELGHTLNLGHGGGKGISKREERNHNCKPNYVSIMNNDHPRIFQFGGSDGIIDYSPPRHVLGGRSSSPPPDLDENALVEGLVLDAGDPDNLFVFVEQGTCDGGANAGDVCVVDDHCESERCVGTKKMHPLNMPVDWNGMSVETKVNIDTVDGNGGPVARCKNNDLTVMQGHDDWSNISLPFIVFGDSADRALNAADGPEPTLEEELRFARTLNTADLGIVQSAPAAVEVGDSFPVRLTLGNKGPNPALVVQVIDTLPNGVAVVDAGGCVPGPLGRLTCDLSTMLRGGTRQLDLTLGTDGGVCANGLPRPVINIATAANVARFAGPDPNPSDNVSATTVTPIDTTAPIIESLTTDTGRLWPPNHRMVPVTVSAAAADLCDSAPACRVISVTSNEPVNGRGDGNTSPDWEIVSDRVVNLRAERVGGGSGRIYTITTECRDASGNSATASVNVTVAQSVGR